VKSVTAHDAGPDPGFGDQEDSSMAEVFIGHYPSLVRLAAMLLDDSHAAEDVVQDAYVRVAARHYRLRDPDRALAYLRQTVVNLARNSLRRRLLARRHEAAGVRAVASAEDAAIATFERQEVVRRLRALSRRHREVLVLRYYLDCSIEETAGLLGLSTGAVKAYASRGLQQLKAQEQAEPEEGTR
jgi:RNA polymerase sigma-70 factor (sigma-E family)